MSRDILRPCPFCGRPVVNYEVSVKNGEPESLTVHCDCGTCVIIDIPKFYANNMEIMKSGDAMDIWNTRYTDDETLFKESGIWSMVELKDNDENKDDID